MSKMVDCQLEQKLDHVLNMEQI